jgi:FkbM family methyltransferase
VIRIDDFPSGVRPIQPDSMPIFIAILDSFAKFDLPVHLGCVPDLMDENKHSFLRSYTNIVFVQHGVDHCYDKYSKQLILTNDVYNVNTVKIFDEFEGQEENVIYNKLINGKKKLLDFFNVDIDTFIPVCNIANSQAVKSINKIYKAVLGDNIKTGADKYSIENYLQDYYGRINEIAYGKSPKSFCFHITWEYDEIKKNGFDSWFAKFTLFAKYYKSMTTGGYKYTNKAPKITLYTSINPSEDSIERQRKALNSWMKLGLPIYSINHDSEIKKLTKLFPDVTFIATKETSNLIKKKPYVKINTILNIAKTIESESICLINSDIEIIPLDNLFDDLQDKARHGLVIASRYNYDKKYSTSEKEAGGIDIFAFNKKYIDIIPKDNYCMGQPVWDYWIPFQFANNNIPVHYINKPLFFHQLHPLVWDRNTWEKKLHEIGKEHKLEETDAGRISRIMYDKFMGDVVIINSNSIERDIARTIQKINAKVSYQNNIPKKAFFIWGKGTPLSYLRYLTLKSFRDLHPDYEMTLYLSVGIKVKNWDENLSQEYYDKDKDNIKDYLSEVQYLDVEIKEYNKFSFLNPSHISDLFRWEILYREGGWYFDVDQYFLKRIDDTLLAHDFVFGGNSIAYVGVLGAKSGLDFFKYVSDNQLKIISDDKIESYLSFSTFLFSDCLDSDCYRKLQECGNVLQTQDEIFYPVYFTKLEHIFGGQLDFRKYNNTIAVHWHGGHPVSQQFNKIYTAEFEKTSNDSISLYRRNLLKMADPVTVSNTVSNTVSGTISSTSIATKKETEQPKQNIIPEIISEVMPEIVPEVIPEIIPEEEQLTDIGISFYTRKHLIENWDNALKSIGTPYGGYTIPDNVLTSDSIIYSLGLGEDASFDIGIIESYKCQVRIFDPTPRSITFYDKELAQYPQISFYPIGVWDDDCEIKFYSPKDPTHVSHSIDNLQNTESYFQAKVKRLQTIITELKDCYIDLLKIDIEGAEYAVLQDMIASNIKPLIICLEFHKPDNNEMISALNKAGYKIINSNTLLQYTFIL